MKPIWMVVVVLSVALAGCAGDSKADPAKDAALKASFEKKPDINTLKPGMRQWVQGMIDSSKKGQPPKATTPPPSGN
jgi:hypothetical protein